MRFFKQLLKGKKGPPLKVVTDKLKSYSAAKNELIPSVEHSTVQYENNRCELSHQPARQQENRCGSSNFMGKLNGFFYYALVLCSGFIIMIPII